MKKRDRKYLAFDIETAKVQATDERGWTAHRPLGISCAATLSADSDESLLWHGACYGGLRSRLFSSFGKVPCHRSLHSSKFAPDLPQEAVPPLDVFVLFDAFGLEAINHAQDAPALARFSDDDVPYRLALVNKPLFGGGGAESGMDHSADGLPTADAETQARLDRLTWANPW